MCTLLRYFSERLQLYSSGFLMIWMHQWYDASHRSGCTPSLSMELGFGCAMSFSIHSTIVGFLNHRLRISGTMYFWFCNFLPVGMFMSIALLGLNMLAAAPFCKICILSQDISRGSSRCCSWLSLQCLVPCHALTTCRLYICPLSGN